MSENALDKVPMIFGPHQFTVKVHGLKSEVIVSTRTICAEHGAPISYIQTCAHCHDVIKQSVVGTPAPSPTKQRYCTNQQCGDKVENAVESLAFCSHCKQVVDATQTEDAYVYGGGLFRLSSEQYAGLKALRRERGIEVIRALSADQQPSLRYVRGVLELRPGDKDSDVLAFNLMRHSASKQRFSFAAYSVLKDEQAHQTFVHEHGALVQFESDGTVLLVQLLGQHEVRVRPTSPADKDLPLHLLDDVVRLHQSLNDPVSEVPWKNYLSTPGTRDFHGALEAIKNGQPFEVSKPATMEDKTMIAANKLVEDLQQHIKQARQEARAATRAADKDEQAEPVAASASGNDKAATGEATPST